MAGAGSTHLRGVLCGAGALVLALAAVAAAPARAAGGGGGDTVNIRGTAYSFDNQVPIAGATIRARGAKGASTTSGPYGRYSLEVPARSKVTPYIEAEGYHGIFLQTFNIHHRNRRHVNFQVPTEGTYLGLAALLDVQLDANGDPRRCAIVSTASTVNVRDLSWPEFIAYGAHGVAGATASARPALPDPVYFNESVIPDVSLTETTVDGGIVWTEVPSGNYRVRAHAPTRFARFRARCRDGRIVNANPPWGLHQLRRG